MLRRGRIVTHSPILHALRVRRLWLGCRAPPQVTPPCRTSATAASATTPPKLEVAGREGCLHIRSGARVATTQASCPLKSRPLTPSNVPCNQPWHPPACLATRLETPMPPLAQLTFCRLRRLLPLASALCTCHHSMTPLNTSLTKVATTIPCARRQDRGRRAQAGSAPLVQRRRLAHIQGAPHPEHRHLPETKL